MGFLEEGASAVALQIVTGFDGPECPFCGELAELELFEVWSRRQFQVSTCCMALHDATCELLAEETSEGAELLRELGIEEVLADQGTLRRTVDDGCGTLVLDWKPELCDVTLAQAKEFVDLHHKHCPPPVGWKFGKGIMNGTELIGVVMVGRPVARMIDQKQVVEVNRNCVRRDLAPGLVWNAASQLYGYAAKEAKRRGYAEIISYTLESERGVSIRAAGWEWDGRTRGGSWSTKSRPREDKSPTEPKNRWKKVLKKGAKHQQQKLAF